MCGSMADIKFPTAEYRRGKKKESNHSCKIECPASATQGGHNKCVFSFCLKTGNAGSGSRSSGGRSFPCRGPTTVKLLSPNRLQCVRGTNNIRMSLEPERSGRRLRSDSWRQWRNGRGCPLVVHYWADLQSVHGFRCCDNREPNAKCQRVLALCLV